MNSKASVKVYSSTPSGQVAEIQYLSTGYQSLRTINFHSDLKTGLSLYLDKPLSIWINLCTISGLPISVFKISSISSPILALLRVIIFNQSR